MEGNMVLKITGVVFLTLFFINWVCLLSSRKIGKIPLGDFILIGLLISFVFYNSASLKGLAQCIPDGINILVGEVDEKTSGFRQEVFGIKSGIDEIFSDVRSLTEGEFMKQIPEGFQYHVP